MISARQIGARTLIINCSLGLGFGDGLGLSVMVEFGTPSAFRGWVRVRVFRFWVMVLE